MSVPVITTSYTHKLQITNLRHPFLPLKPNSIQLPDSMLITGANMGGKSTLLKSTCLAVILA